MCKIPEKKCVVTYFMFFEIIRKPSNNLSILNLVCVQETPADNC